MNTAATRSAGRPTAHPHAPAAAVGWIQAAISMCERVPHSAIALLARFSIAAVFWKSGQTKIEGLVIDIVDGTFVVGWPRLADSAVVLFRDEFKVPLLSPEFAALLATGAEHVLPLSILIGLATRFSALGLLGMTAVIQLFVYPDAYPTHGVWAAVLLLLIARGPGAVSIDAWLTQRYAAATRHSPVVRLPADAG